MLTRIKVFQVHPKWNCELVLKVRLSQKHICNNIIFYFERSFGITSRIKKIVCHFKIAGMKIIQRCHLHIIEENNIWWWSNVFTINCFKQTFLLSIKVFRHRWNHCWEELVIKLVRMLPEKFLFIIEKNVSNRIWKNPKSIKKELLLRNSRVTNSNFCRNFNVIHSC